jgi:hypothetical protein
VKRLGEHAEHSSRSSTRRSFVEPATPRITSFDGSERSYQRPVPRFIRTTPVRSDVSSHTFALLLVGAVWLSVALAVAVDATGRGRYGGVWGVTTFLLGPVGLGLYALAVLSAAARPDSGSDDGPARDSGRDGDGGGADSADDDAPATARVVRSGERAYCDVCRARVGVDADRCPDCGAVFG